jgi:hypothetical protein
MNAFVLYFLRLDIRERSNVINKTNIPEVLFARMININEMHEI